MSGKIIATIVVGVLLASTGLASARPKVPSNVNPNGTYYDYQPFYYDQWSNNYYDRSYWGAFAPTQPWIERDPYAGTIWQGVWPY